MFKRITSNDVANCNDKNQADIEMPSICPNCNTSLVPQILSSHHEKTNYAIHLHTLFFCPKCHQCFIGEYITKSALESCPKLPLMRCFPESHHVSTFSENISSVSPKFIEIYNQSEQAENAGLHEICGIGYRKSLEFLVKDYSFKTHPESEDRIKSMALSPCIKEFIANPKIQTLAIASAWLGNDETHYVKKHEAYSITQLKTFILSIVSFVDCEIEVEKATSFINKK